MSNIKPLYLGLAGAVVVALFVWGLVGFIPWMLIGAALLTGFTTIGLAAARFRSVRSLGPLLQGAAALWLVVGKWVLSLITEPRIKAEQLVRADAEAWEFQIVVMGALVLLLAALWATKTEAPAADAALEKTDGD